AIPRGPVWAPHGPNQASCRRRGSAPCAPPRMPSGAALRHRAPMPASRNAIPPGPSEALGQPGDLQRVPAIGAGHLPAEPWRGHHLAGIGALRRVEGATELLERGEVGLVEQIRHVALLVHADTVLAGDRATRIDTREHDL